MSEKESVAVKQMEELIPNIQALLKEEASIELSEQDIHFVLSIFFFVVKVQVQAGRTVVLPYFGKFLAKDRAARVGRNPKTGEAIQIAAKRVPVFAAAKKFKDVANSRFASK